MTVEEITPQAALALIEQGAMLVDIRDPDEYAREHIPAARLLPLGKIEPVSYTHLTLPTICSV